MPPTFDRLRQRDRIPFATVSRFQVRSIGCSTEASSLWTMTSESWSQSTSPATCSVLSTQAEKSSCRRTKRFGHIDRFCNSTGCRYSRANVDRHLIQQPRGTLSKQKRADLLISQCVNGATNQTSAYVSARITARGCSLFRAKCWLERGDSNSRPPAPEASARTGGPPLRLALGKATPRDQEGFVS